MQRSSRNSVARRRGVTLVELLLVLAVLVVLGAMAFQALTGTLSSARLSQSAEQVRTAMTDAKLMAIDQAQPALFRVRLGTGEYRIETAAPSVVIQPVTTAQAAVDPAQQQSTAKTGQLEEGIVFRQVMCTSADGLPVCENAAVPAEGEWSMPVVFMPTGVAYNAEIFLARAEDDQRRERQLKVVLRGLTCTAQVHDVAESEVVR